MTTQDIYEQGFICGLKAYAYWNNGTEYVGTTGTTLHEAIQQMRKTWNYSVPTSEAKN